MDYSISLEQTLSHHRPGYSVPKTWISVYFFENGDFSADEISSVCDITGNCVSKYVHLLNMISEFAEVMGIKSKFKEEFERFDANGRTSICNRYLFGSIPLKDLRVVHGKACVDILARKWIGIRREERCNFGRFSVQDCYFIG